MPLVMFFEWDNTTCKYIDVNKDIDLRVDAIKLKSISDGDKSRLQTQDMGTGNTYLVQ